MLFGAGGIADWQPRSPAGLAVALLATPQAGHGGEQPERKQAAHGEGGPDRRHAVRIVGGTRVNRRCGILSGSSGR